MTHIKLLKRFGIDTRQEEHYRRFAMFSFVMGTTFGILLGIIIQLIRSL